MSRRLSVMMLVAGSLGLVACGDDDALESSDSGATARDAAASHDAAGLDADDVEDAEVGDIDSAVDAGVDAAVGIDAAVDASAPVDAAVDAAVDAVVVDSGPTLKKPTAAGDLVITEIMAAPTGYSKDNLAEWIEIYNPGDEPLDLAGCTFADKLPEMDYTIAAGVQIGAKSYLTLASNNLTVELAGFVNDIFYGGDNSGLSGTSDSPNIYCAGMVIDVVNYGVAGFPVPDSNQGRALQLDPDHLNSTDNDTGSNWCASTTVLNERPAPNDAGAATVMNYGTPKKANVQCP